MRRFSLFGLVTVLLVAMIGLAVAIAAEPVQLAPGRELSGVVVYATFDPVVFQSRFSARYEMVNNGEETYSDLQFIPNDSCGPSHNNGTVEFSEVSGNGDDLFEPGEVWSYFAPDCVEWAGPWISADIYVSSVEGVAGSYWHEYEPQPVISVVEEIGDITFMACEPSQHMVTVQNMSTNDLTIDRGLISPLIPLDDGSRHVVIGPGQLQALVFNRNPECETRDPPQPPVELTIELHGSFTDNEGHHGEWYFGGHWERHDWIWCSPDQGYSLTCGDDWHVGAIVAYTDNPTTPAPTTPAQTTPAPTTPAPTTTTGGASSTTTSIPATTVVDNLAAGESSTTTIDFADGSGEIGSSEAQTTVNATEPLPPWVLVGLIGGLGLVGIAVGVWGWRRGQRPDST